jgi:hypothetical protein
MKILSLRRNNSINIPVILTALVLAGLAGAIILYAYQSSIKTVSDPGGYPPAGQPTQNHDIRGFRYTGAFDGQKAISIRADRFSIRKKKIGFFRFGLLNEVRFDNARIDIYGRRIKAEKGTGTALNRGRPAGGLSYGAVFSKESMVSFPAKRIATIVFRPVQVVLHDETSEAARISAGSGVIRMTKRDVMFKGNVRVSSGRHILWTDRLKLLPEKTMIITDGPYTLQTPGRKINGQRLTADIYLNPVSSSEPGKVGLRNAFGGKATHRERNLP